MEYQTVLEDLQNNLRKVFAQSLDVEMLYL